MFSLFVFFSDHLAVLQNIHTDYMDTLLFHDTLYGSFLNFLALLQNIYTDYMDTLLLHKYSVCVSLNFLALLQNIHTDYKDISIENRIYREEFTRKKCKKTILLYCFHTAGVLHIFMLYSLLGPGISFYRKSKIIVKRILNYEIGWFHN